MKVRRCISKTIKPEVIVRAYELINSTDMSVCEAARALQVNFHALDAAIRKAEINGLYVYVKRVDQCADKILDFLAKNPGKAYTPLEVAEQHNGSQRSYRQACARLYKRHVVSRNNMKSTKNNVPVYGYYLEG